MLAYTQSKNWAPVSHLKTEVLLAVRLAVKPLFRRLSPEDYFTEIRDILICSEDKIHVGKNTTDQTPSSKLEKLKEQLGTPRKVNIACSVHGNHSCQKPLYVLFIVHGIFP